MFKSLINRQTDVQIVEAIHAEFDSAQDRLLAQAKEILNSVTVETPEESLRKKSEALVSLGFTNAKAVKKLQEKVMSQQGNVAIVVKNKETAKLITEYKQCYPFLVFLTVDELNRICEKYNLIHAPVSAFIGDVPEKNIQDIKNAQKLLSNHVENNIYELNYIDFYSMSSYSDRKIVEVRQFILKLKLRFDHGYPSPEAVKARLTAMGIGSLNPDIMRNIRMAATDRHDINGLFIAAPKSQFDLSKLQKTGKRSFGSFMKVEPKDPIVFRYVKGGIQVLTKWGVEASDPALVNPINN